MIYVTVPPYVLANDDGADPRIVFPVTTPAAMVVVESRMRGRYTVTRSDRAGVAPAIGAVRAYAHTHRERLERLYEELDRSLVVGA